ncbi:Yip1 domain-containing protein [Poseidonocella pacifica]|uniref:Yip1 domain-containing protein n=1 Tax=Poseidonocella pacifica TaxID=871651 RepID=A0A1I0YMS1_9RHOB|nr:YIP1 family protein [Poseidonocella pacifica]SFB14511.1 Yip1 domain-containing protein [Poseidonocella pacifica]
MNLSDIGGLLRLTLTKPRDAAGLLLAVNPGKEVLWLAFILVGVLSALAFFASNMLLSLVSGGAEMPATLSIISRLTPIGVTAFLLVNLGLFAGALYLGGRVLNGQARFGDIALLVVWQQFLMIVFQFAQTGIALIAPAAVSVIFTLASSLYLFWVFLVLLAVVERFGTVPRALAQFLLALVGLSLLLATVTNLIGAPPQGTFPNV